MTPVNIRPSPGPAHRRHSLACKISLSLPTLRRFRGDNNQMRKATLNYYRDTCRFSTIFVNSDVPYDHQDSCLSSTELSCISCRFLCQSNQTSKKQIHIILFISLFTRTGLVGTVILLNAVFISNISNISISQLQL